MKKKTHRKKSTRVLFPYYIVYCIVHIYLTTTFFSVCSPTFLSFFHFFSFSFSPKYIIFRLQHTSPTFSNIKCGKIECARVFLYMWLCMWASAFFIILKIHSLLNFKYMNHISNFAYDTIYCTLYTHKFSYIYK